MSLEKCMFFLPNRLSVQMDKIFVSFDISSIPADMHVNSMVLHVPLPLYGIVGRILTTQLIMGGWDEQLMLTGYQPIHPVTLQSVAIAPNQLEQTVDLTAYQYTWRFESYQNHGVYVELSNHGGIFFPPDICPYLIVATV